MPAPHAPAPLREATARMEAVVADFKRRCNVHASWNSPLNKLQGDLFTAVLVPLYDDARRER